MGLWYRLVARRRFILLALGLWLLGILVADPPADARRWAEAGAGLVLVLALALLAGRWRHHALGLLAAAVPFRAALDPLADLAAPGLAQHPDWAGPLLAALLLLVLWRLAALLARWLDVRLRRPWFSDAVLVLGQPRAEVWAALCLPDPARHWDPRLRAFAPAPARPGSAASWTVTLAEGRRQRQVTFHEIERDEEVFLELRAAADPGFCEGLGPVLSALLETVPAGTRLTLAVEIPQPTLVRLARYWLDDGLGTYARDLARALARRAAAAAAPAQPRKDRLAA